MFERPTEIPGGDLLSVNGLRGAGVASGLKESGDLDLALVVGSEPWTAAGVFTRSRLPAAPVTLCRERLAEQPQARAVVINSGNANALTGARGDADARRMARRTEELCGGPVLVLSTGVIGVPLPLDAVVRGIGEAAARLRGDAGDEVARAMLTTDTRTKTCAVRVAVGERVVTVGGVAKGSGMIHPDMATMLALIAVDLPVSPSALDALLRRAVDRSFHEITVDGDTSTNDSVLLLAGGEGEPVSEVPGPVAGAVEQVAARLARMIVEDGEGASRVMELSVTGGATDAHARLVARAVATSSLVKTALAGGDPNWGRILAAAATVDHPLEVARITLTLGGVKVFAGRPLEVDQGAVDRSFSAPSVEVALDLGQGTGRARMLSSDLTRRYVEINADYRT